jgi:hypothetical protein
MLEYAEASSGEGPAFSASFRNLTTVYIIGNVSLE